MKIDDDYLLGTDVLGALPPSATGAAARARAAAIAQGKKVVPASPAARAREVAIAQGQKVDPSLLAAKLNKAGNRAIAVGNKLSRSKRYGKAGRKLVVIGKKAQGKAAKAKSAAPARPTPATPGVARSTRVKGDDASISRVQQVSASSALYQDTALWDAMVNATDFAALLGETIAAVSPLVDQLKTANPSLSQSGQTIADGLNNAISAYDPESGDWSPLQQAGSFRLQATSWIPQAQAAVSAPAAATPPPGDPPAGGGGGGGDSGGGGGGGGEEGGAPEGEEGAPEGGEEEVPVPDDGGGYAPQEAVDAEMDAAVADATDTPPPANDDQAQDVAGDDEEEVCTPSYTLKSELEGVDDEDWTKFVCAMRTAKLGDVGPSNELGTFQMKLKRLADLGLVQGELASTRASNGRKIWVGDFKPPLSARVFLTNPKMQYLTFVSSMKQYVKGLDAGTIPLPPEGLEDDLSLSGKLAILHRAGPHGLKNWNDTEKRFEGTQALVDKANWIF